MQPNSIYIGDSSLQIHKTLIIPNFKVCFFGYKEVTYFIQSILYWWNYNIKKKNIYQKFYSLCLDVGLLFAVKQVAYLKKY